MSLVAPVKKPRGGLSFGLALMAAGIVQELSPSSNPYPLLYAKTRQFFMEPPAEKQPNENF